MEFKNTLVVDFFESTPQHLNCFCYNPADTTEETYTEKQIALDEFETWLSGQGYLQGSEDDIYTNRTHHWKMNIYEFIARISHNWNVENLLTQFLNLK